MKCIIAGSRDITDYTLVRQAFSECEWANRITEIVSGQAKGVDTLGEKLAKELCLDIIKFPADWGRFGTNAGFLRNGDMANYADIAIVIMKSGGSNGSRNMIRQMKQRNKPVIAFEVIGDRLCPLK